ncbi:MAG TPA: lysophospholipid acyltransferase family protein [Paracoccaceae bacterium]|nr:lysophospholipid acyltransferase family protein [Paracoccaceae bacterium]
MSRAVLLLRSLAFDAVMYGLLGAMGLLWLPVALISRDATYFGIRLWCRMVLAALALLCGLRTGVRGEVPAGEVLVAAKHQSFLDILILLRHLPRPKFVMKAELRRMPVFGFYAMRIGCVPVEREKGARAMGRLMRDLGGRATEPGQTVIYPQGTRVAPGAKVSYKAGAAALYQRFGLACVPAATNTGHFWGRNSLIRRPGLALVEFLEPLPPGLPARAFLAEIEARIEAASDRLAPPSEQ